MSNLEKLLEGVEVEWKPLGEIANINRGRRLIKKQLEKTGKYAVYQNCMIPLGYHHESNVEAGTTFIICAGSAGEIGYSDVAFWAADDVYYFITKDDLQNKFLYYFLLTQQLKIHGQVRRSSVPRLSKTAFEKLQIPIPYPNDPEKSLEVQKEIVHILDKFSTLTAELQAELQARKSQYEYYRNQLLTYPMEESDQPSLRSSRSATSIQSSDNPTQPLPTSNPHTGNSVLQPRGKVEWKTLKEISLKISSGGTPSTSNSEYYNGDIPWLRTQEVGSGDIWDTGVKITKLGLTNSSAKMIPANCVIVAMYGATVGKVGVNKIPLCTNQACANIQINEKVANYRYVYHFLLSQYEYIKSLGAGSQTNINAQIVKNLQIPIPSLKEQERIVAILDKFDILTTSITDGLPKEIELRHKQYEYYRDMLLSFPKNKIKA